MRLPIYNNKKLLLAFEYGVVLSDVCKDRGITLTPEMVERCEGIILNEFSQKNSERVALDMVPNILASLEAK